MSKVQSTLARLTRRTGLDALLPPPEQRFKAWAAAASVLCNALFFWLLFRQGIEPGDPRLLAADNLPVLLAAPSAQSPSNADSPPQPPSDPEPARQVQIEPPSEPVLQELADSNERAPQTVPAPVAAEIPQPPASIQPPPSDTAVSVPIAPTPRIIRIPAVQQSLLTQRMVKAATDLKEAARSEVSWTENGQAYSATLTREPSTDSMAIEQVVATVTTTNADGTQLQTQLKMQRLAFSQFTQVVDYWDSRVQLHDDEIVGRFHSNSPFVIGADGNASPKFLGKVTTAAPAVPYASYSSERRGSMFAGGLQTRAGRIEFPQQSRPFNVAPGQDSHVQTFSDDAHIVFFADGSYTVQARSKDVPERREYPRDRPSYFLAAKGATLFVRGIVHGKVLIYSPERIVIEGDLIYAANPRTTPEVDDYLGLVSDRNVEIAPRSVTGRGDLNIHAAIFARNRFVVTGIDSFGASRLTSTPRPATATLFLYGSLTVGSISATEPRYATKLEFDPRLDRRRPPGFPNTNRYELASWQGAWSELEP